MLSRKELLGLTLGALAGTALPARASARAASGWVTGQRSRARMLAGDATDGALLAGIEIAPDPGFKTYWRMPGESGLPPTFDWSRSENLAGAEVQWPVPTRFEDAGGVTYGYKGPVVLPVRVSAQDATRPVGLELSLDYGVCDAICVPAHADLRLTLAADTPADPRVRQALARVPRRAPLGAPGDLAVLGVERSPRHGADALLVRFRAPAGREPRLFVEAPEGWFVMARGTPEPAAEEAGASGAFVAEILERPSGAAGPLALVLTLAAGDEAVETAVNLDSPEPSR